MEDKARIGGFKGLIAVEERMRKGGLIAGSGGGKEGGAIPASSSTPCPGLERARKMSEPRHMAASKMVEFAKILLNGRQQEIRRKVTRTHLKKLNMRHLRSKQLIPIALPFAECCTEYSSTLPSNRSANLQNRSEICTLIKYKEKKFGAANSMHT